MLDQKYTWKQFPNIGYISCNLTEQQIAPIKKEISLIENNFDQYDMFNGELVGHLQKEYLLIDNHDYISSLVLPLIGAYEHHFNYLKTINMFNNHLNLVLDKTWVNFQKKYEFNPPHNHSGVFSFAMWINVPFNTDDERKHFPNIDIKDNRTAAFCFHYTNAIGKISEFILPVDKTWENTIVVFPSELIHSVNPFYLSDGYRISVSGNFKFNTAI